MQKWVAMVLVVVASCGEVKSSGPDGPVDGPPDASPDGPAARCNSARPFGTAVALATLNSSSNEGTASLSADERTVYFASNRPGGAGGYDIYVAARTSPSEEFGTPALLDGVNTPDAASRPVLTADGLTLYAEVQRGTNPYLIERATRTSMNVSFGALMPIPALASSNTDSAPYIMPDHSAIYFTSSRGDIFDLYRAGAVGSSFNTPSLVSGMNFHGSSIEDYPTLSADELTIYFASNRAGGSGGIDIWVATRVAPDKGFGSPVPLAAINTTGDEWPGWISPDGCAFYFLRRTSVSADTDIFVAHRPAT